MEELITNAIHFLCSGWLFLAPFRKCNSNAMCVSINKQLMGFEI